MTFRTQTELVTLYATVRGPNGRLVTDLSQGDFTVVDDGVSVPISTFSNSPEPVTAVVMADMSGSTNQMPQLHRALRHFAQRLSSGDRLRIGTFGEEISVSPLLTNDLALLERVIAEELDDWPTGATPLWRGIDAAIRSLADEAGRQVVVVLTDGIDYSPRTATSIPPLPGGVAGLRQRIEANPSLLVYAIGTGDIRQGQRLRGDILRVVRSSGGGHVDLRPEDDLSQVLDDVGEELRRHYVIGFVPRHHDGKTHPVRLRVSMRGATVQTRESYRAPHRGALPPTASNR